MFLRGLIVSIAILISSVGFAQYDKSYVTVGVGYDLMSFRGDLNQQGSLTSLNNFRGGFNFFIEKRFMGLAGVSINGLFGKVSQYENSSTQNLYFQSKINQFDLRLSLYLDNKYLLGHETLFTPYFSGGIGYLLFDPYGDLIDADGNTYYYWHDGSIKDLPETEANEEIANDLTRDYEYETQLTDPSVNYSRGTLAFPLTLGVNCKLSHNFNARVATTYTLTATDYIDNTSLDNKKDKIISTNFSLTYTFGKKDGEGVSYKDVDFSGLFKDDYDRDGVKDLNDLCQQTPMDVPVDENGCPFDTDRDGVPDYLDKEENTSYGAFIDESGKTLTDDDLLQRFMDRDSTSGAMEVIHNTHTPKDVEDLKEIDKQIKEKRKRQGSITVPNDYNFADYDRNGIIHSTEALQALDSFLEGELDVTIDQLHGMIDYYFDQ